MLSAPSVILIHTGDELLCGLKVNHSLVYLGEILTKLGLRVKQAQVVVDDLPLITHAIEAAWKNADIVLITGGLGPTQDDMTRLAVSQALGLELEYDEQLEKQLTQKLLKNNQLMSAPLKKQCYKPKGCEALENLVGDATGLYFRDAHTKRLLIALPGPTQELRSMFQELVLPRLKEEGYAQEDRPAFLEFLTAGISEAQLMCLLKPILAEYPAVSCAYRAHLDLVNVRLVPQSKEVSWGDLEKLMIKCSQVLGEDFVGIGDISLSKRVQELLKAKEASLSVAESCTGGLLAHLLTQVPGASTTFNGGAVCYSNDTKMEVLQVPEALISQHGPVSAELAVAMASGAAELFSTDYALSITGFAGPDGGDEHASIGTVFVGYHAPQGIWVRRLSFHQDRQTVQLRAAHAALDWLRRELLSEADE